MRLLHLSFHLQALTLGCRCLRVQSSGVHGSYISKSSQWAIQASSQDGYHEKELLFQISIGFRSAPTVPLQCPYSAPTVPRDSALHDSLCKFCTREQFRSNGGNRRERYSFYLNISFVAHVCLFLMGNLYGALSRGTVGALLGHCQGTVRGTVPFL